MSSTVLRLQNVHAGYAAREVLRGVSLELTAGEWFCLLGPNGAGKSTLLRCIGASVRPSAGSIWVAGHSLSEAPLRAKTRLGFACAPEQLPPLLTGQQCLEIYACAKGMEGLGADTVELAERLGFAPFLHQCVDTYSLGTRQKLSVLLALLGRPALIVLDEAFNGLDPRSALLLKRALRARLAARDCAVLLATHSLDIVEHYADRAALLIDGRIEREWDCVDLAALRQLGGNAIEEAVSECTAT